MRVTVVKADWDPLVPAINNREVPVGVVAAVEIVIVEELPHVGFGENEAVAPGGSPVTLNATQPVKPPIRVTVIVEVTVLPAKTCSTGGLADNMKVPLSIPCTPYRDKLNIARTLRRSNTARFCWPIERIERNFRLNLFIFMVFLDLLGICLIAPFLGAPSWGKKSHDYP